MKKIISLLLVICLLMTGCGSVAEDKAKEQTGKQKENTLSKISEIDRNCQFNSLDDENLCGYLESAVYSQLIDQIDSDKYFIENVSAEYLSQEYIEELAYNSQENIYFGYTLSELEKQFEGKKYVFYYDEAKEQNAVKEFEEYDNTYEKALTNIAAGSGMLLICVTASAITGGSAPAVSIVFAAAAKTGTEVALSSSVISGVSAGIIEGIQTKNPESTMKVMAREGSKGFKLGAIFGILAGGIQGTAQVTALKGADVTANGLTLKQAAKIQKESKYPLDVIKQMHSMEEYNVYKEAGLKAVMVNGKTALIPDIDLSYKSKLPDGTKVTNLKRMKMGYAPIDPVTKKEYQLHHIGQKADATLAVLNECQHQGNASILNIAGKDSEINRSGFATTRKNFWKYCGNQLFAGGN